MPQIAAVRADRIRAYEQSEGAVEVERFLDAALAIAEFVDPDPKRVAYPGREEQYRAWQEKFKRDQGRRGCRQTEYDDLFCLEAKNETKLDKAMMSIPPEPERDVLGFIRNYADYLEDWQRDIIDIVRDESIYFRPQMRTKIMNEGWASFWHKRIMREMQERGFLAKDEELEWWRLHSGVLAASKMRLNPYHFGMYMFEYLEDYYNGWLEDEENRWLERNGFIVYPRYQGPIEESPGRRRIFQLRQSEDDQSFVRNNFDRNSAARMNLFIYQKVEDDEETSYVVVERGWEQIRDMLVAARTNAGYPYLEVVDGDYNRRHELYLRHIYEGIELDIAYVEKTLPYIFHIWKRPVHLETVVKGETKVYSYSPLPTRS